jgi:hypothetical protein
MMMAHSRERFTSNRQSISLHDITGIESSVHYRYQKLSHNPAEVMGELLCDSLSRMDNADNLVDILRCRHEEELPMLGGAFSERRLVSLLSHSIDGIALGDICYETEPGNFVVVDNIHRRDLLLVPPVELINSPRLESLRPNVLSYQPETTF